MRLTAASQRQRLFCCGLLLVLLFTASAMLMVARFFCSQNSSCSSSSCLSRSFATTTSTTTESVGIIENVAKEGSTTATKNEMPSPVSAATTTLITETQYYLNDRTIRLSPYVDRSWLRLNSNVFAEQRNQSSTTASATTSTIPEPKVKLILTDFGWNHPIHGIKFSRTLRSRELLQAFIDHPYFDPTFRWSEQMEHAAAASASASNNNQNEYQYFDPSVTYIVMFDLETTFESNYPHYRPSQDIQVNSDLLQGRKWKRHEQEDCGQFHTCERHFKSVVESPLFRQLPTSTHLIYVGFGFPEETRKKQLISPQVSLLSISAEPHELLPEADMGFPPPSINALTLTYQERLDIETCASESLQSRPFLLSFIGHDRKGFSKREELFKLHNDKDIIVMPTDAFHAKYQGKHTYDSVMRQSRYAAAPRGHSLFSYRFTEALSAGAIPIVQADNWVLPFRKELIDWSECAIIVPEKDTIRTLDFIQNITEEQQCRMRQRCYWIYQTYMANPEGEIAGAVDSLLAMDAAKNGT